MSELWVAHLSVAAWQQPALWTRFFEDAQRILGSPLTHLDVKDPVRRKVASLVDAGNIVCEFETQEDQRWLYGKFADIGVEFSVEHSPHLGRYPNAFQWHVPVAFVEEPASLQQLKALFDLGNQTFRPFYAYADDVAQIASKNKPSGAVDIEAELLGVFWLTYFNAGYVAFFGTEKFNSIPGVVRTNDGGATITLGESPYLVTSELREQASTVLGRDSFVDLNDLLAKPRGRYVLTLQQLRAGR